MKIKVSSIIFLFTTLTFAEVHSVFKNFAIGREGLWETTTTISEGPTKGQQVKQKTCVNAARSKAGADAMMEFSKTMTQCKTKVTVDTRDLGESVQDCVFGQAKTHALTKMKRLGPEKFQMEVESTSGGVVTKTQSISQYVGPCPASDKPAQNKPDSDDCKKCKAHIKDMTEKCSKASAQEKTMCEGMSKQMAAMCKMSCG